MKKALALLMALCVAFGAVACAAPALETTGPAAEATAEAVVETTEETPAISELNIIYITPSTESQYWGEYMLVGVENAAADIEAQYGVKVNISMVGPALEAETDGYVKAFENAIAKKPDAIITGTLVPDATAPLVQEAFKQGIIVNFMSLGLAEGYEEFYGTKYYCDMGAQGAEAAKAMLVAMEAKGIEPKGKVGVHMSVVVPALEPRMSEFAKYMAANAPEIECLVTLYNENDVNNAQANCENQISTYGAELIGLYGANNVSGDGLTLAIKNAGLSGKIAAVAIDSDDLEVEALANGTLDAIVVQTPYQQAYTAVMSVYNKIVLGQSDEKDVNVNAVTVTKDKMNDDEFKALLDPTLNKRG
ncbi:MAG: substrate-binding domain-containing protein [Clostridia bacterium]